MILVVLALASAAAPEPAHPSQGRAMVECRVTASGHLRDCKALSESPPGHNVGAFAVKLAGAFQVPPGDRRVRNGKIRIPMRFKLPEAR